jgi:uncharacterized membrane protein (UPF0127 family)
MNHRYHVTNVTKNAVLADASGKVDTPLRRGIGLIGKKGLPPGGGLVIQPCNSVVSFFMRFPIDVIFLDRDGVVCHVIHSMVPWRTSKIVKQAKLVVELPAGTAKMTSTEPGDRVTIEPV